MHSTSRVAPGISRRHLLFGMAAALLFAAAAPLAAAAQQRELSLHAYRFWREPDLTLVEVFASIPLAFLPLERTGATERAEYSAVLTVTDASGLQLTKQEWQDTVEVPAMSDVSLARASTTEHFTFQLKPGQYTVSLEVRAGDRNATATHAIEAYTAEPEHSDLVIAAALNRLAEDVAPAPEALVRGTLEVLPNVEGVITTERPGLGLYAEIYRNASTPDSAEVWLEIRGDGRAFRYATPKQARVYPAGAGSEAFALNLAGLPPGRYRLGLTIDLAEDSLVIEHPLEVLAPGAGVVAMADEIPYQGLNVEQLDSIFQPMKYIASPSESNAYEVLRDADAKRRFIAKFWQDRAGIGGMTAQQLRLDFEDRVAFAERNFFSPVRDRSGWRSDRGRILLRFGTPAQQFNETERQGQYNPWQVWKYSTGRGDKFVFLDRSGFGDFELVFSTAREEPTQPDWERFFSQEALEFIRSY